MQKQVEKSIWVDREFLKLKKIFCCVFKYFQADNFFKLSQAVSSCLNMFQVILMSLLSDQFDLEIVIEKSNIFWKMEDWFFYLRFFVQFVILIFNFGNF